VTSECVEEPSHPERREVTRANCAPPEGCGAGEKARSRQGKERRPASVERKGEKTRAEGWGTECVRLLQLTVAPA